MEDNKNYIQLTSSIYLDIHSINKINLSQSELELIKKQFGITHILTLHSDNSSSSNNNNLLLKEEEEEQIENAYHEILNYSFLLQKQDQSRFFLQSLAFFTNAFELKKRQEQTDKQENKFGILLRCDKSITISMLTLLCYLMIDKNLSFEKGIDFITERLKMNENCLNQFEKEMNENYNSLFEDLKSFVNERKRNLILQQVEEENNFQSNLDEQDKIFYFVCKMCRCKLFESTQIMNHQQQENTGYKNFSIKKQKKDFKQGINHSITSKKKCTSIYFNDKLDWMGELKGDEGNINCPKCGYRVGAYKWSGNQCSCGVWVCPSVQIQLSRVDKKVNELNYK
ncbi:hypothetical protein ABK040_008749 [Willaertia magna]